MGTVQISVEKSVIHDEETGIGLPPLKSQAGADSRRSMDTFMTSKTGTIVEDPMMR